MTQNKSSSYPLNKSLPLLSVILSVRNGYPFISNSINSILNQTFKDFEFIIIDDGSTDESRKIIVQFAERDERIIPIFQEHSGLTKALNRGVKMAQGTYIARQDADDTSLPNRFEKQLPWLENKHYDLCCCRSISVAKNRPIPRRILLYLPRLTLLRYLNPYIHGSFIIRKSILDQIGGYDESYTYAQDYKLIYDLYSTNSQIKYLAQPLYCTNYYDTSIKMVHNHEQRTAARRAKQLFRNIKK